MIVSVSWPELNVSKWHLAEFLEKSREKLSEFGKEICLGQRCQVGWRGELLNYWEDPNAAQRIYTEPRCNSYYVLWNVIIIEEFWLLL